MASNSLSPLDDRHTCTKAQSLRIPLPPPISLPLPNIHTLVSMGLQAGGGVPPSGGS